MLEESLNKSLFGQPLVKNTIVDALRGHFNLNGPKKALVLSFHGSTGVGTYRLDLKLEFKTEFFYSIFYLHVLRKKFCRSIHRK